MTQLFKKQDKNTKLKEVLNLLKQNKIIKIKNGCLWLFNDVFNDKIYICYRNFGQSAIKPTLKDLSWLLKTVFEVKNLKNFDYKVVNSIYA